VVFYVLCGKNMIRWFSSASGGKIWVIHRGIKREGHTNLRLKEPKKRRKPPKSEAFSLLN